ncbi:MAG: HEAT repeat domain-containing protein [Elusimicrobia bacterium]|nr:HEAT repeat domain-containing protein [Elusimicrobiota bacterium]
MGIKISIEKVEAMISRRDIRGLIKVLLNAEDQNLRCLAAIGLGDIGNRKATEYLIRVLEDEDVELRRVSAEALGKLKDFRAVEPLIKALEDGDIDVRFYAIGSLGDINDPIAVKPLIEVLENKDEDDAIRMKARKMLGNIGSPAIEPLIRCLESKDYIVRWYAALSLGEIGDRRAEAPLIKALMDDSKEVRGGAAGALKYIGGPEAVEPLIKCLESDESWINRKLVAVSLGVIKDKRALEQLTRALNDKIDDVKVAAREALKNINQCGRV